MGHSSDTEVGLVDTFGREMRTKHFNFAEPYTPLNHGSYGCFPNIVRARQRELQDLVDSRPDPAIRMILPELLNKSRAAIAPLLGVSMEEVVFVPNATTAVNTVLRNLKYDDGDVIVYFSTAYPACQKTVEYLCETTLASSVCILLQYPLEDQQLVQKFRHTIRTIEESGRKAKVAMFDTVLTFPAARVPWELLVGTCREIGILSLVDGAHGVGHIDLRHLGKVGPDFSPAIVTSETLTTVYYETTAWLYLPRGCAIFHVPFRNHHLIRSPLPTSHGYQPLPMPQHSTAISSSSEDNKDAFGKMYAWVGTIDLTAYCCVPEALHFRNEVCGGEDAIMKYSRDVVAAGAFRIAEILGTEVMRNKSGTLQSCCFANVRLPFVLSSTGASEQDVEPTQNDTSKQVEKGFPTIDVRDGSKVAAWISQTLIEEFDTYLVVLVYAAAIWVRVSGQIYLEIDDFERAGHWLQELCGRAAKGDHNGTSEV